VQQEIPATLENRVTPIWAKRTNLGWTGGMTWKQWEVYPSEEEEICRLSPQIRMANRNQSLSQGHGCAGPTAESIMEALP
jgi:hypothetical protein